MRFQNISDLSDAEFINKLSNRRKKLYWRAIRRGMKESDLILGGFARANLDKLTEEEVDQFEAILSTFDQEFITYITGKNPIPQDLDTPLFQAILDFKPYLNDNKPLS